MNIHARLTVSAALLMLSAFPASAAEPDGAIDGAPYVRSESNPTPRALTEAACTRAGDVAAAFADSLQGVQGALLRSLTETRIEATREIAPLMHRFADRLRELARQLEQAPHDS